MYRISALLSVFLLFLGACSSVPITGRQQLNLVSEDTMASTATQQYQQFLNQADVVRNTSESAMVKEVGRRIASAVEEYFSRMGRGESLRDYNWEFNLIDSQEVNAWAMPGGKVAVYRGILPVAQSEAGLAAIMSHEVAHVVARHGSERMSQGLLTQMGGIALSAALSSQPQQTQQLWSQIFGAGAQIGVMLPYSRLQENEADRLGLIFMALAGYDPRAAVEVWQRMAAQGGPSSPEFLSTHPADQTRIRKIQQNIPEAMRFYQNRG